MSKRVVLKSFAELAVALHLEDLPDEPTAPIARPEVASDEQGSTVDVDHLMAELEAACADLHAYSWTSTATWGTDSQASRWTT